MKRTHFSLQKGTSMTYFQILSRFAAITALQAGNQWANGHRVSALITLSQWNLTPLNAGLYYSMKYFGTDEIVRMGLIGAEEAAHLGNSYFWFFSADGRREVTAHLRKSVEIAFNGGENLGGPRSL
jgi:hypothetical protein